MKHNWKDIIKDISIHNFAFGNFYDRCRATLIEREQVITMRSWRRSIRNKSRFCAIR